MDPRLRNGVQSARSKSAGMNARSVCTAPSRARSSPVSQTYRGTTPRTPRRGMPGVTILVRMVPYSAAVFVVRQGPDETASLGANGLLAHIVSVDHDPITDERHGECVGPQPLSECATGVAGKSDTGTATGNLAQVRIGCAALGHARRRFRLAFALRERRQGVARAPGRTSEGYGAAFTRRVSTDDRYIIRIRLRTVRRVVRASR
jgi:hypothetical protein